MIDVEKTIDAASSEMKRLGDAKIVIEIAVIKAVSIVSNLQLAMRHPKNDGPSSKVASEICDRIISLVGIGSPDLAAFCRLGFDPRYDEMASTASPGHARNQGGPFAGMDLRIALEESVKLQSHYAELLNLHDGGKRVGFKNADAWIERLRETGTLPKTA